MSEATREKLTDANAKPTFRKAPNVIAIASGKGGVGKTWFSITLSHALAMAGKKVLLFDGDLGLANVDVQLGLMPKRDLNDVFEGGSVSIKLFKTMKMVVLILLQDVLGRHLYLLYHHND